MVDGNFDNVKINNGDTGNVDDCGLLTFEEDSQTAKWLILKRGSGYTDQEERLVFSYYDGSNWHQFIDLDPTDDRIKLNLGKIVINEDPTVNSDSVLYMKSKDASTPYTTELYNYRDGNFVIDVSGNLLVDLSDAIGSSKFIIRDSAYSHVAEINSDGLIHGGGSEGDAFKIGDDIFLVDVNEDGAVCLQGANIRANAKIYFGSGEDVNLYRGAANKLETDDDFAMGGSLYTTKEVRLTNDAPDMDSLEMYSAIYGWTSSNLTVNATLGQKNVYVQDGTKFSVGNFVAIRDDNAAETNEIASISVNTLTMVNNLAANYSKLANGGVDKWTPDGLDSNDSFLNLRDNGSSSNEVQMFVIISEDNYNAPLLAIDQGMVVQKDLSVGGFLGTNQGELWMGHGRFSAIDKPKIILQDAEVGLGYDTLYLRQLQMIEDKKDVETPAHLNTGHIGPGESNTYDLGTDENFWANVYADKLQYDTECVPFDEIDDLGTLKKIRTITDKEGKQILDPETLSHLKNDNGFYSLEKMDGWHISVQKRLLEKIEYLEKEVIKLAN